MFGGLLLPQNRRQAGNLRGEGGADVLAAVGDEVLDGGEDFLEEGLVRD